MATQSTISMDGTTPRFAGEVMPTCGTNNAPATPDIAAAMAKTTALIIATL